MFLISSTFYFRVASENVGSLLRVPQDPERRRLDPDAAWQVADHVLRRNQLAGHGQIRNAGLSTTANRKSILRLSNESNQIVPVTDWKYIDIESWVFKNILFHFETFEKTK
jgi:hypothetical protein